MLSIIYRRRSIVQKSFNTSLVRVRMAMSVRYAPAKLKRKRKSGADWKHPMEKKHRSRAKARGARGEWRAHEVLV